MKEPRCCPSSPARSRSSSTQPRLAARAAPAAPLPRSGSPRWLRQQLLCTRAHAKPRIRLLTVRVSLFRRRPQHLVRHEHRHAAAPLTARTDLRRDLNWPSLVPWTAGAAGPPLCRPITRPRAAAGINRRPARLEADLGPPPVSPLGVVPDLGEAHATGHVSMEEKRAGAERGRKFGAVGTGAHGVAGAETDPLRNLPVLLLLLRQDLLHADCARGGAAVQPRGQERSCAPKEDSGRLAQDGRGAGRAGGGACGGRCGGWADTHKSCARASWPLTSSPARLYAPSS